MPKYFHPLFIVFVFNTVIISAQTWNPVDANDIVLKGTIDFIPEKSIIYEVSDHEIKDMLFSAPREASIEEGVEAGLKMVLPLSDGSFDEFSIFRYKMMESRLAKKYNEIRTFKGLSTTNAHRSVRIDYTIHGLRAVIRDNDEMTYIDYYLRGNKDYKLVYARSDYQVEKSWSCSVNSEITQQSVNAPLKSFGDCALRTYRLAVAAAAEYSNILGASTAGTSADSMIVMSGVINTINRVNEIYEQDLTVRFILIDDNDQLMYFNPATDPYSAGTGGGSALLAENQTNVDNVIGTANYDIGHVFTNGGAGVASLQSVCNSTRKARGVTGIASSTGDPFDIDYVAHEIGHQFGGNHTQNNSCNRSSKSFEPGSGHSIMGYAGICSPNVQSNSDAFFHAGNIEEMTFFLEGATCDTKIAFSNAAPVFTSPLMGKSIPRSTPFVIRLEATDADGDELTYTWDQMDTQVATMPPVSSNTGGPTFRGYLPRTSPIRYFPKIEDIKNGSSSTWEVLPSVNREMNFLITVRDHSLVPACKDTSKLKLNVDATAGPFTVSSQSSNTSWTEMSNQIITWNVAGTNAAPINCGYVDILISYDDGLTYPDTLATMTPNDGSKEIVVPEGVQSNVRFIVKCSDNYFFNINGGDINIQNGSASYDISINEPIITVCPGDSRDIDISSYATDGFNTNISLTANNLPTGSTANFSVNPLSPGNSTILNLSGFTMEGTYLMNVVGTANGIVRTEEIEIRVVSNTGAPTLQSPSNNAVNVTTNAALDWSDVTGALFYEYQVSLNPDGSQIILEGSVSNSEYIPLSGWASGATLYWRIRPVFSCGPGSFSSIFNFSTISCESYTATNFPITILDNPNTTTSEIIVKDRGIVNDVDVNEINIFHTWIDDLDISLISPDNTSRAILTDICAGNNGPDNMDMNLDDEAPNANYPCPPTDGGTYQPEQSLDIFDTKSMSGIWTFSIFDDTNQDSGQLNGWALKICADNFCDLTVNRDYYAMQNGSLEKSLDCAIDGDTIFLQTDLANKTINMGTKSINLDKNLVIIADPAENIVYESSAMNTTLNIAAGKTVELIGFTFKNLSHAGPVISNSGSLILKDFKVINGALGTGLQNTGTGTVEMEGVCELNLE